MSFRTSGKYSCQISVWPKLTEPPKDTDSHTTWSHIKDVQTSKEQLDKMCKELEMFGGDLDTAVLRLFCHFKKADNPMEHWSSRLTDKALRQYVEQYLSQYIKDEYIKDEPAARIINTPKFKFDTTKTNEKKNTGPFTEPEL